MARKAFCVPALVTSFIAIVLLVLTTVSVPTTYHKSTPFDIVRANNLNGAIDLTSDNRDGVSRARFGLWGYCTQPINDDRFSECTNPLDHMYVATFASSTATDQSSFESATISRPYTRGLVTAAVALVVSVIGFILAFIPSLVVELIASFTFLIATLITLAAFIVQIIFFIYVRSKIHDVAEEASVYPGPAFYFTLVSIPLLFFSALTVCCGYRKGRKEVTSDDTSSKRFLKA